MGWRVWRRSFEVKFDDRSASRFGVWAFPILDDIQKSLVIMIIITLFFSFNFVWFGCCCCFFKCTCKLALSLSLSLSLVCLSLAQLFVFFLCYFLFFYLESLLMTRMSAPFSSRILPMSERSSSTILGDSCKQRNSIIKINLNENGEKHKKIKRNLCTALHNWLWKKQTNQQIEMNRQRVETTTTLKTLKRDVKNSVSSAVEIKFPMRTQNVLKIKNKK